jgi:hypothetical protein
MPRTIMRNEKMLFGPCAASDLAVIASDPLFENHGICAQADPQGVQVYVTLPEHKQREVHTWYLSNHTLLSVHKPHNS